MNRNPLTVKAQHIKVCFCFQAFPYMKKKNIYNPFHMCLCVLCLQDKPYDKDDEVIIKATYFEVISMLRDVLETTSLWRDQVQTYTQVCSPNKVLHVEHKLYMSENITAANAQ